MQNMFLVNILGNDMSGIQDIMMVFVWMMIGALIMAIISYVIIARFLNKFNKLVYGKGTPLAWVPICNIYLLGKLTVNKLVGWVLVICRFLSIFTILSNVNITSNNSIISLFPSGGIISIVYSYAVCGLFIYAIFKYFKLKKNNNNMEVQAVVQPVQPQPMSQLQNVAQPVQPQPMSQPQNVAQPVQPQPMSQPQNVAQPVQSQPMSQPQNVAQPVQPQNNNINIQ